MAQWETDEIFCAHAGWIPHANEAEAVAWSRDRIAAPGPKLIRLLAVHDEQVVGYVDLYGDQTDNRELGYLIAPASNWARGLGTAAARAGLAYGFHILGLRRIWAEAVEAHEASVRILRRLGMRMTGAGEVQEFLGRPSRYLQFELLHDEWPEHLELSTTPAESTCTPAPTISVVVRDRQRPAAGTASRRKMVNGTDRPLAASLAATGAMVIPQCHRRCHRGVCRGPAPRASCLRPDRLVRRH